MMIQSCRKIFRSSFGLLPVLSYNVTIPNKKLATQVFSDLSYGELTNPRVARYLINKPIPMHSRVSQRSLYHKKRVSGIIRSCFSEKKHKVFRRVQKLKRSFYSQVLEKSIFVTLTRKAFRTINLMGSFDNYIICTKPKDLDSKYGQYLRELMLRKINNPSFRVPAVIIGTNRKLRIKNHRKQLYLKDVNRFVIPKQIKKELRTYQRKFGTIPQQLTNQDYKKYLQLQTLKRTLGDDLQPTHPLLIELKQKMNRSFETEQQQQKIKKMAKNIEQQYLADPKLTDTLRKKFQKSKQDEQLMNLKLLQLRMKSNQNDGDDNIDVKKQIQKSMDQKQRLREDEKLKHKEDKQKKKQASLMNPKRNLKKDKKDKKSK